MGFTQEQYAQFKSNLARGKPQGAVAERAVQDDAVGAPPRANENAAPITVRITSLRQRLLDPDNLCPKWFVDGLRYAGLIPDDRQEDITLEVRQKKVTLKSDECTVIAIDYE